MNDGWTLIRDLLDVLVAEGREHATVRGQSNNDWETTPSIFRRSGAGIHDHHRLDDWKWRAARSASPMPQDSVESLTTAQQYGLPTPLLVWTTSPLEGLCFACADDAEVDSDGCVWLSGVKDLEVADHTASLEPFRDRGERPFVIDAVERNVRSMAQDSSPTLHTSEDMASFSRRRLFAVRAELKPIVLNQLENLGFAGDRLLCDVNHLVAAMTRSMRAA